MATTATGTATFNTQQQVRRSNAAIIRQMDGVHVDRLVVHNNLIGAWTGADPNKPYCGLVPVVNNQERFDLAWLSFDLQNTEVAAFNAGAEGDVTWEILDDELHRFASQSANGSPTYDTWLNAIASHFSNGGTFKVHTYNAKNKKGGTWRNAILGINL